MSFYDYTFGLCIPPQDDIRRLAMRSLHGHKHSVSVVVAESVEDNAVRRDHQHGVGNANWLVRHLGNKRNGTDAEQRMSPSDMQLRLIESATATGSLTTRPTPARVVLQGLATGRNTTCSYRGAFECHRP
jgi:hypothetical protein